MKQHAREYKKTKKNRITREDGVDDIKLRRHEDKRRVCAHALPISEDSRDPLTETSRGKEASRPVEALVCVE